MYQYPKYLVSQHYKNWMPLYSAVRICWFT